MLLMLEVGRRCGVRRRPKESEGERSGLGTGEGAVFALFGLMVAFTFSGAASRFNEKRMLTAEEANCIETAYLRLRLLSHPVQPALRELFRRYVDSRIETYRILPNMVAAEVEMAKSKKIQEEVWTEAVEAIQLPDSHASAGLLLLPALNNMIDIATTAPWRYNFTLRGSYLLCCSAWGSSVPCWLFFRMSSGQHRSWLHILGFTVLTVIIVYVMLDVEYPRAGLIRLESADQLLVNLREHMKSR